MRTLKHIALTALLTALLVAPAPADYVIRDGQGTQKTVKSGTVDTTKILQQYQPVDSSGNPYTADNPLPTTATLSASGLLTDDVEAPLSPATATATKSVTIGAPYNSTQPTFTNTQQGAAQLSARGALIVGVGTEGFAVTTTALNALVGEVQASPTANTLLDRLKTINTTLGSPMQASGGTVAATQSGTWNVTNISGTVSLPTGAATAANQSTIITALGSPMQASGGSVTVLPTTAAATVAAVTVTASSAQAIASGSRKYLLLKNESTADAIACRINGTAALNTAGSITILPYGSHEWDGSYVPSEAINCIGASSSVPLTVVSN